MTSVWGIGVPQTGIAPITGTSWSTSVPSGQAPSVPSYGSGLTPTVVASENINEGTVVTITPAGFARDEDSAAYFGSMVQGFVVFLDQMYPARGVRQSVLTIQGLNRRLTEKYNECLQAIKSSGKGEKDLRLLRLMGITKRGSVHSSLSAWESHESYVDKFMGEIDDAALKPLKDALLHTIPEYVYARYRLLGVKAQVPTGGYQHMQPGGMRASMTPDYSFGVGVSGCHRVFPYWEFSDKTPENLAVGFMLKKATDSEALAIHPWSSDKTAYTVPLTVDRFFVLGDNPVMGKFYPFGVVIENAKRPTSQGDMKALFDAGFPSKTDSSMRSILTHDSQLTINIKIQGQIVHEGF